MKWCLLLNNNVVVSDILECNESMLTSGSSLTVQVSDDRTILERTMKMFSGIGNRLTIDVVNQLKQYRENDEWLKIQELLYEKTGNAPCCQGVVERFMDSLE